MDMYEIIVPHNELFCYWEDDGMLWHVKDPNHTHPKFDTRGDRFKENLWKWNTDFYDGPYLYSNLPPMMTSAGFFLLDNSPKVIQAFTKWCVKSMAETRLRLGSFGDDQNYIFAHRSHGDKLEITYFIHPKITNRPVHWIG